MFYNIYCVESSFEDWKYICTFDSIKHVIHITRNHISRYNKSVQYFIQKVDNGNIDTHLITAEGNPIKIERLRVKMAQTMIDRANIMQEIFLLDDVIDYIKQNSITPELCDGDTTYERPEKRDIDGAACTE